jgi:transcriptional regulator with XRE-family HTH domain/quercetin dioxygenase-like cupin family protein
MMHPGARAQIRSARRSNGLSLRELGRRTGVTASLLSQIENGKSDPSVSTLSALVSELGLSLDALLRSEWDVLDDRPGPSYPDEALNGSAHDGRPLSNGAAHDGTAARRNGIPLGGRSDREVSPVIRPPERQTLDLDSGVVWERLTRGPSELLDALLVTYEPGATSSSSGKLLRHSGIEHAYLMSGELTLQLGFETYRLRAGDSLEFDGSTPHVYCNQGDVPARGLWFVLGRDNLPITPGPQRLLDLSDSAGHDLLAAVDFLQAISRD